ncbi:MAG: RecQ family ATP-dependent DNA helicase, partial [Verrucomicrobiota bacterium]
MYDELRNGQQQILFIAPERLSNERFLQTLGRQPIDLMVIDEAHCISEWGHNFRPDYLKLADLSRDLKVDRVLALTATATEAVAEDILRGFSIGPSAYVNTGFYRPNLTIRATPCSPNDRQRILMERIKSRERGATIVYVTLQKTAEQVADFLFCNGLPAKAYHAGMDGDIRHATQDWFMQSSDGIVVATIAFGMGIDKSDIRYVYHYNLPKSLENYMQETGRAGRDGRPSSCDLLICPEDIATLENFSYGDTPTREAVHALTAHLMQQSDRFDISVYELSANYDIRNLVVSTLLTYLETEKIIASTGPFYDEYKFQPHRGSADMLAGMDEDRTRFLKALFQKAEKKKIWFSIDITRSAEELSQPRERLVSALNYLEEQGDLTLKVAGIRRGYRFIERPASTEKLAEKLFQRFQDAETRDIARIGQMVELGSYTSCTVRHVLDYFGKDLARDCGHCDRCLK